MRSLETAARTHLLAHAVAGRAQAELLCCYVDHFNDESRGMEHIMIRTNEAGEFGKHSRIYSELLGDSLVSIRLPLVGKVIASATPSSVKPPFFVIGSAHGHMLTLVPMGPTALDHSTQHCPSWTPGWSERVLYRTQLLGKNCRL